MSLRLVGWCTATSTRKLCPDTWGDVVGGACFVEAALPGFGDGNDLLAPWYGTRNQNVVPWPGTLRAPIVPPINRTIRRQIASPRPVPPKRRVVVESTWMKGWNSRR